MKTLVLPRPPVSRLLLLAAAAALALTGCGGGNEVAAPSGPAATGPRPAATAAPDIRGTITVFAAASLTGAFAELGVQFQAAHPGATVTFNFAGSSALAQQIVAGAPADVFAAASPATMKVVTTAGDSDAPQVFVRNRLQIAVPAGNPGGVTGLDDFAKPPLKIALCASEVPCGAAAAKAFAAAGITPAPDTLEQDVKATLAKVSLGEVDAALVYRTDVLAAGGKVEGISFSESDQAVNDYPLATLSAAPNRTGAQAFVAFVLSPDGQRVLTAAGFDRP